MTIKSIRIKNILSFNDCVINEFSDFNCIIGQNNVGKSNFLKIIQFFYAKLNGEAVIPPPLNSNYTSKGSITITYDTRRLEEVIKSKKTKSSYQKHIYSTLFKDDNINESFLAYKRIIRGEFSLTLTINSDGSVRWSDKDVNVIKIIARIYPFFFIDTRRINLYDWDKLWKTVSQLKFLNTKGIQTEQIIDFFDEKLSEKSSSYKEYVKIIGDLTKASPYDYQDLILNYIKVGLSGHKFNIDGHELNTQSDGTNSHRFIELFLSLIISLTRREFITPIIYIDEPELGLHPKLNEKLVYNIHELYRGFKKNSGSKKLGKYATPYPTVIMSTHSPNILKSIIRLFQGEREHYIFHFSLDMHRLTNVSLLNSRFKDKRFLNIFSDNEARLFFSEFILFVEGETELELFGNLELIKKFPFLNRVDVYKTNEVLLRAMNPRNSNASIPHLTIYDADKMVSYDIQTRQLILKTKEVNLFKIYDRFKFTPFFSQNFQHKKALSNIIKIHESKIEPDEKGTGLNSFNFPGFILRCNRILYKTERIHITPSTIEEVLICDASRKTLLKWLVHEMASSSNGVPYVGGKGDINRKINGFREKFHINNLDWIYTQVFTKNEYHGELSEENKDFISRLQILNARKILKLFYNKKTSILSRADQASILRLALNGKTHTLCSYKEVSEPSEINTTICSDAIEAVTAVKHQCLMKLPIGLGKTDGWVTSFLEFAIADIESRSNENLSFEQIFSSTFPHLHDILKKISISIA
jgi:AAA15 family ATPase/GTPase